MAALLLRDMTWGSQLMAVFGTEVAGSSSVSIFLFGAAAYVAGQLISPPAKLVQRAGELKIFRPGPKSSAYDWLGIHHEKVGAHRAKIRAEFTMHNGLAVVLLGSALAYPLGEQPWRRQIQLALVLGGLLAVVRGRTTRDTFHDTVNQFARAAGFDQHELVSP